MLDRPVRVSTKTRRNGIPHEGMAYLKRTLDLDKTPTRGTRFYKSLRQTVAFDTIEMPTIMSPNRLAGVLLLAATAHAAPADSAEFFEIKIRPILANRCYGCH